MASNKAEGAQVAVIGTTHELTDITDDANYLSYIDLSEIVLGDIVLLHVNLKNRATGTIRRLWSATFGFNNTNNAPLVASYPVSAVEQVTYELNQVVGTMTADANSGTISVGDAVTGQSSGATGVLEFTDDEDLGRELRVRVTSDGTAFTDGETIEKDGATSNTIDLLDATPAQSFNWAVPDPLGA